MNDNGEYTDETIHIDARNNNEPAYLINNYINISPNGSDISYDNVGDCVYGNARYVEYNHMGYCERIYFYNLDNLQMSHNTISDMTGDIFFNNSDNLQMSHNTISHVTDYINISSNSPSQNHIGNNTFTNNTTGLMAQNFGTSSSMHIENNTITDNSSYGIYSPSRLSARTKLINNKIYNNGVNLDFFDNGQNINDPGDTDTDTTETFGETIDLMNHPVIKQVSRKCNELEVIADLDFNPSEAPYTIEFFDNSAFDPSNHGGEFYIGSVTTSETGDDVTLTVPIEGRTPTSASGITSIATNANNSSSEFSARPLDTFLYDAVFTSSLDTASLTVDNPNITLDIESSSTLDNVTEMIISHNPDFTDAAWESYSTSKEWRLSEGAGSKDVYVQFRDGGGCTSTALSLELTYTPVLTGSLYSLEYTTKSDLEVLLQAGSTAGDVVEMNLDGNWIPFSSRYIYELEEGENLVVYQFRDDHGNESGTYSRLVTLTLSEPIESDTPPSPPTDTPDEVSPDQGQEGEQEDGEESEQGTSASEEADSIDPTNGVGSPSPANPASPSADSGEENLAQELQARQQETNESITQQQEQLQQLEQKLTEKLAEVENDVLNEVDNKVKEIQNEENANNEEIKANQEDIKNSQRNLETNQNDMTEQIKIIGGVVLAILGIQLFFLFLFFLFYMILQD